MRPTAAVGLSGARVGFALVCDPDAMPRIARGEGGADRGVNTNSAPAGVSVSPRRCARGADTNGGASGRRERCAAPAGAGLAQGGCARRRGGIRQAEGPMTRLPLPSALWAPAQPDLSLSGPMQRLAPWGFHLHSDEVRPSEPQCARGAPVPGPRVLNNGKRWRLTHRFCSEARAEG